MDHNDLRKMCRIFFHCKFSPFQAPSHLRLCQTRKRLPLLSACDSEDRRVNTTVPQIHRVFQLGGDVCHKHLRHSDIVKIPHDAGKPVTPVSTHADTKGRSKELCPCHGSAFVLCNDRRRTWLSNDSHKRRRNRKTCLIQCMCNSLYLPHFEEGQGQMLVLPLPLIN